MSEEKETPPLEESGKALTWSDVWTSALIRPSLETYERILNDPNASPNRAYGWVFLSALIAYLISFLVGLAFSALGITSVADLGTLAGVSTITLICCLPIAVILAVIGLMIGAAITQLAARILGGTGTYSALVYAYGAYVAPLSLVSGVVGSIPFVNLCLGIPLLVYGIVLNVISVNAVNKFGWGKSIVAALIIPITFLLIVPCAVIAVLALLGPAIGDVFSQIVNELSAPVP
jgi:hypothetical protein